MTEDETLNAGLVERVGDTVRRPRGDGCEVVESLLLHLEHVGASLAPRFLGIDDSGRQILSFIDGEASPTPTWQGDDVENAERLGAVARLVQGVHESTEGFVPPEGAEPKRPLPLLGSTWTHGDVGYGNVVIRGADPIALIDWEFAAPAHPHNDLAGLLAFGVRGPRPDIADPGDVARREDATKRALDRIVDAASIDDERVSELIEGAAVVCDDAAAFWTSIGRPAAQCRAVSWRASWFRSRADWLASSPGWT